MAGRGGAAAAGIAARPGARQPGRAVGLALGRVMILGTVVGRRVAVAIAGVRLVLVTTEFRRGRMAGPQARKPVAEVTGAAIRPAPGGIGPGGAGIS